MVTILHGMNLPLEISALLTAFSMPPAAGHLHKHDGDAPDIVARYYGGELFGVILRIKLWTADQGDATSDKLVMEIAVCVSGTICGNEQISPVKIRRTNRNKLDLNRPLRSWLAALAQSVGA